MRSFRSFLLFSATLLLPPAVGPCHPVKAQVSAMDVARADLAAGRGWRAAQALRSAFPEGIRGQPELLLLLAEAEGSWGNWEAVRSLLERPAAEGALGAPLGWFLLGRSLEERGDWEGAAEAYGRSVSSDGEGAAAEHDLEARVRLARARQRAHRGGNVTEALEGLLARNPRLGEWLALEGARERAVVGEVETTLALLARVEREEVRLLGWDLPAAALLAGGDSAAAEAAYWSALPALAPGERSLGWVRVGTLRLARGDSSGAGDAFHRTLEEAPTGTAALPAARALLTLGFDSASVALAAAEAFLRAGQSREALRAFEAYGDLRGGAAEPPSVLLSRVRAFLGVDDRRGALELLEPLSSAEEPGVAAPALAFQAAALGALGRSREALEVQNRLVERFPDRPEAVEVLFSRASTLEGRGDRAGALAGYRATVALSPAQNLAGEARMREGQILLAMGRAGEAAQAYRSYLAAFPEGRRWDQAAFWAGRILLAEEGGGGEGASILQELRKRFALSYYAVEAGRLLGEPYEPEIPRSTDTLSSPGWVESGLALVDELRRAGLDEGAGWELSRLMQRGRDLPGREGQDALLLLALELNERGLTREGINLGWELRREGRPWDTRLLSAIYPFPFRDIVAGEARSRGLDPFLVAGLIRQESAFWAEARSRADARGLMQVLPGTGAELARSVGPREFDADAHLYRPEINIHLGVAFLADLVRRFGTDLPILLSAYNAGPTRAVRWREYPEAGDAARFTERIPFEETRGYVKAVTLNREIYAWLYGGTLPDQEGG